MRKYWKNSMLLSASKSEFAKAAFWEQLVGSQLLGSGDDSTLSRRSKSSSVVCRGLPTQEVLRKTATLAGCPWPSERALPVFSVT